MKIRNIKILLVVAAFISLFSSQALATGNPELLPGFPVAVQDRIQSTPAFANLDNDPDLEIVVSVWGPQVTWNGGGKVYAFKSDGSLVPGWPITTDCMRMNMSPAVGDLDGDGSPEIIVGGDYCTTNFTKIYVWHADGTSMQGWPKEGEYGYTSMTSQAAIADIDGDGTKEIIINFYDDSFFVGLH